MQNTRKTKSQFFKFSSHLHNIFLCRKFSCISSLLGSYSMVERLKDLCLDVDDDCMEKREMLARDITEVMGDKHWPDNDIICCRLWIFVTTQNITALWCTELYKPYQTNSNNTKYILNHAKPSQTMLNHIKEKIYKLLQIKSKFFVSVSHFVTKDKKSQSQKWVYNCLKEVFNTHKANNFF